MRVVDSAARKHLRAMVDGAYAREGSQGDGDAPEHEREVELAEMGEGMGVGGRMVDVSGWIAWMETLRARRMATSSGP